MRTLYIVRHAKSSWADPGQRDSDRPLNERGLRNAAFMADLFQKRGDPVDLIVSSPAVRARTTAEQFAKALSIGSDKFIMNASIYDASVSSLMQLVQALPESAERIMLFGHNPGLSDLAYYLCDEDPIAMSTCTVLRIDLFPDQWEAVSKGTGNLIWHDFPKRYPGQG